MERYFVSCLQTSFFYLPGYAQIVELAGTQQEFVQQPDLCGALLDFCPPLGKQVRVIMLQAVHFGRLDADNGRFPAGIELIQCIQELSGMGPGLVEETFRKKRCPCADHWKNMDIISTAPQNIERRLLGFGLDVAGKGIGEEDNFFSSMHVTRQA